MIGPLVYTLLALIVAGIVHLSATLAMPWVAARDGFLRMTPLLRDNEMVLVAPAPDFTSKLMTPEIPPEGHAALAADGVWLRPSAYGEPYPISRALLEDGARWSILTGAPVPIEVPVRILQGGQDPDVPWRHALELVQALKGDDVVFTLIRDGDHRLSRPQDIDRLIAAVEDACAIV